MNNRDKLGAALSGRIEYPLDHDEIQSVILGPLPEPDLDEILRIKQGVVDGRIEKKKGLAAANRVARKTYPEADGVIPWFDIHGQRPNGIIACHVFARYWRFPYIGHDGDPSGGAVLTFARSVRQARRLTFPVVSEWYPYAQYIDIRASRLRGNVDYLKTLATSKGPHVIESPPVCPSCEIWGGGPFNDGACIFCR